MSTIKVFQKKNYIPKDGTAPLYVYFYTQQKKIEISTKVSCQIENFDTASGKITSKEKGYKDKNLIVDKILARINDIMVKFRLSDKTLTKDAFWKMYKRPDNFDTFFAFVRDYWKKHPYEIEFTTHKTHTDIINKLEIYKQDLHFDEISEDFITKYKIYLSKKFLSWFRINTQVLIVHLQINLGV